MLIACFFCHTYFSWALGEKALQDDTAAAVYVCAEFIPILPTYLAYRQRGWGEIVEKRSKWIMQHRAKLFEGQDEAQIEKSDALSI